MAHIKNNQQALLTRVKKIRGQLNAVEKSLTEDTECLAILQQVTAIKGAVNGLMTTILDDHIRAHLGNPELTDTQRNEEIDALSKLLKSYLRQRNRFLRPKKQKPIDSRFLSCHDTHKYE